MNRFLEENIKAARRTRRERLLRDLRERRGARAVAGGQRALSPGAVRVRRAARLVFREALQEAAAAAAGRLAAAAFVLRVYLCGRRVCRRDELHATRMQCTHTHRYRTNG